MGFTAEQLYATASYQTGDLTTIVLGGNDLSGWDFTGKDLSRAVLLAATLAGTDFSASNLSGAQFDSATFNDANFSGAVVRDADFQDATNRGFAAEQLYVTESYRRGDLHGSLLGRLLGTRVCKRHPTGRSDRHHLRSVRLGGSHRERRI